MHPTRREMLRLGLGSSALLACGPTVPLFLARSARALAGDRPADTKANGRILVVVQLDGGNDGLNTVVPYRDDEYRKHRPRIQIGPGEVKKIDDRVGLHPSLDAFSKLLEKQRLAIVQSVGYPNPNRSHFESMATWQTARLDPDKAAPGWLAQAIDHRPRPEGDAPALHIHESFPLPGSLAGGQQVIPSLARLEQFRRRLGVPETADPRAQARGPRPPGPPRPRRAWFAASVRRALLRDHICQQCAARTRAPRSRHHPHRPIPNSTAWPSGSA